MLLPADIKEIAPRLLAMPVKLIPFELHRLVLKKALQEFLHEALEEGDFDFLQGHWLCLQVDDLDLRAYFSVNAYQEILVEQMAPDEAKISGSWKAFLELAAQQKDPDTLFFQRKLMISGDTDLCHGVKNMLDSIELSELGRRLQFGAASLNALVNPPLQSA